MLGLNCATDYMIIVAHPDDIEFGCAGTVAQWMEEGKSVTYVVCTSGDKGSPDPATIPAELAAVREQEQVAAAAVLGVKNLEFLRYPDQGIEDTTEFRKTIVRVMREYKPRVVVTMDPYRKYIWHRDHRITGQVVLDAVYPFVRDPLAYPDLLDDGYSPHKVEEIWFFGSENINHRIDITDTFALKIKSLFQHTSQMETMGREKVREWVKKRCLEMASGTQFYLAEGYHRVTISP